MENLQKVNDYLSKVKVYDLTTVDGNKPKCRPIGLNFIYNGKLYFGVGTFKEVYRQMTENPNVEICATDGPNFLRYYGEAVFEYDDELINKVFEINPGLKNIYNEETGLKMGMFYLKNAVAEFRMLNDLKEKIEF